MSKTFEDSKLRSAVTTQNFTCHNTLLMMYNKRKIVELSHKSRGNTRISQRAY